MTDISVIEFGVYGFIAYSSLLMLIISTVKKVPMDKSLSIVRAIFLIPGLICAGVLTYSGVNITTQQSNTANTIKSLNSSETWSETTTQTTQFVLKNPVWISVHGLIFTVLLIYIITQILILLGKHGTQNTID